MLKMFKKDKKESFFSNVIFDMEESEEMHEILSQSRIDISTAENMEGAMKVIYKNNNAHEMIWIEEGDYLDVENVRYKNKPISFRDYPINKYRTLIPQKDGIHQLGGFTPENFKMPQNITSTPNIYLGRLNCEMEESLKWSKLNQAHLVCPIHADFETIYLDYSNPLEPKLLSSENKESISSAYDDLTPNDEIVFKELKVGTTELLIDLIYEDQVLGNIGAPTWIQHELIPKCPKTGKHMKFLIMLETNMVVELETSNVNINDESMRGYIESFNFWCDGALFIFYEPDSKIMAYFIQNT